MSTTLNTEIGEQFASRVLAAMLYSPSLDGNAFRYSTADDIVDECVSDVEVQDEPMVQADTAVFATVDISERRELNNSKCLELFDVELDGFWGASVSDDGEPVVKFTGSTRGTKLAFYVKMEA